MHIFIWILILGAAILGFFIQYMITKAAVRDGNIEASSATGTLNYSKIIKEAVRDGILEAHAEIEKKSQK